MKRIIFLTFAIILVIISLNLLKSIYELWNKKDVLLQTQQKLTKIQQENSHLKQQLKIVQNPDFLEQEARDKLFLIKPGETTVILPKTPEEQAIVRKLHEPNWQQWWELFFK